MVVGELERCSGALPRNGEVSGPRRRSAEGWRARIQGRSGVRGRCGGVERRR
ncbi:hypothetical protein JG688_00011701 [Phytophthora aleatoria]|uniref:Uncharacterized protein n=1 Tax=Phytophthora aleatoria TaxID=2496075 RepID=A0A8J5IT00_9STRA|nr:hypothetical protein JG688_00011701 [Phytophthora aleatoria]